MCDFAVFFPPTDCHEIPQSFSKLENIFQSALRSDNVISKIACGAPISIASALGMSPQFFVKKDNSAWIMVKGIILDTQSKKSIIDLEYLLDQILDKEPADLNRYEGTFALAAWDSNKKQGWAFNDQTSMLNCYYSENDGGLYLSTNGLVLAKALCLKLHPFSILEFWAKDSQMAPLTIFDGLKRINIGEHILYKEGKLRINHHWFAYGTITRYSDPIEAASSTIDIIVDRISRYAENANPIICDLSGGLDTRLLVTAAYSIGLDPVVTVNGPSDAEDVRIAKKLAKLLKTTLLHFNPTLLWSLEINPEIRRELLYRSSGALPFTAIYHHLLTRPDLSKRFNLHMIGTGGEFYRTFTWLQSIKMNNRLFSDKEFPPGSLFPYNAFTTYLSSLKRPLYPKHSRVSIAQHLDLTYLKKLTGHSSQYISSTYNWLPTVAPLLCASVIKNVINMPWILRIYGQLERNMINILSPQAARISTWTYGSKAEPLRFKNIVPQMALSMKSNIWRVDRKLFKGFLNKILNFHNTATYDVLGYSIPFLTDEFQNLLDPKTMFSHEIYTENGLNWLLSGNIEDWKSRSIFIVKLATIEELCRELDFKPDRDFMNI